MPKYFCGVLTTKLLSLGMPQMLIDTVKHSDYNNNNT